MLFKLQTCKIIIWYECTIAHKKAFEAFYRSQIEFRGNQELFGSMLILLSGSFQQTLSNMSCLTRVDELNATMHVSNYQCYYV